MAPLSCKDLIEAVNHPRIPGKGTFKACSNSLKAAYIPGRFTKRQSQCQSASI